MRKIIFLIALSCSVFTARAQWTPSGTNLYPTNFSTMNVVIGAIDSKGYRLAVGGKAVAEEVVIKLKANWPDYVFETNYKLPSLFEVESFINTHKHLPEVPSAEEVVTNGVALGQMDAILLKKLEELTLYMIELKKENNDLKERLESVEHIIAAGK
jgi:hypothetical protein